MVWTNLRVGVFCLCNLIGPKCLHCINTPTRTACHISIVYTKKNSECKFEQYNSQLNFPLCRVYLTVKVKNEQIVSG